jgi:hypothetical protein
MFLAGWWLCQYRQSVLSESQSEQWKVQRKELLSQLNSHSDLLVEREIEFELAKKKWIQMVEVVRRQLAEQTLLLEETETDLAQVRLRVSELEMALDLAHSKAMVKE